MRNFVLITVLSFVVACAEKKTENVNSNTESAIVEQKNREIDSLKAVIEIENQHTEKEAVTSTKNPHSENTENSTETQDAGNSQKDLSGKHSLTLQWISWDRPGTVSFKKTGKNIYEVSGSQKKGGDYLKIEGKITQISNQELQFEGTVETFVAGNGGKCLRTGPQIFLATQNRKYWRMQNMVECFGLTDYVDIYF